MLPLRRNPLPKDSRDGRQVRYQILFYEKKSFLSLPDLRIISIRRDIATHIVRNARIGVTIAEASFRASFAAKRVSMSRGQTHPACRGRNINKGLIMIHKGTLLVLRPLLGMLLSFLFHHVLKSRHNILHFHLSNITDQSRQKCHNKGKEHKHRNNAHWFRVCHLLAVGEVFYGSLRYHFF